MPMQADDDAAVGRCFIIVGDCWLSIVGLIVGWMLFAAPKILAPMGTYHLSREDLMGDRQKTEAFSFLKFKKRNWYNLLWI